MNVSGCARLPNKKSERRRTIAKVKQEIFATLLLTSLSELREQSLYPKWVFDNVKDTTQGERTEGWAQEVFLGLQYTPLWTEISAGAYIEPPEFRVPGSHYLLEVADFISFIVAREFHRQCMKLPVELPSSLLGKAWYVRVLSDGSASIDGSCGRPDF
jgi:hypothetical protein